MGQVEELKAIKYELRGDTIWKMVSEENHGARWLPVGKIESLAALTSERDALAAENVRLKAYRRWLRQGFREIASGTLSDAHKADLYRQYANDCLSGPTNETLTALNAPTAAFAPQPQEGSAKA